MSSLPSIARRSKAGSIPRVDLSGAPDAAALRSLIQEFIRTFGLLAADRTPCGKPLAVSHAHALMVLATRSSEGRRVSQQELGQALGIDKSNVARLCAKMERAGHVKQERSPDDGRSRLLSLTRTGQKVAESVEASSRRRFQQVLDALDRDARPSLLTALLHLNSAVKSLMGDDAVAARSATGGVR